MSLYPSLEDLKVDKVMKAQSMMSQQNGDSAPSSVTPALTGGTYQATPPLYQATPPLYQATPPAYQATSPANLYPNLEELGSYMGLSLDSEELQKNLALVPLDTSGALQTSGGSSGGSSGMYSGMLCPVTGSDVGVRRAEIRPGVREVILCKDQDGKVGLRLRSIDNGVFVQLVQADSPAALAGLRFGDQLLQINGANTAAWTSDRAHKTLKAAGESRIELVVRDRPFQRTVTMHKDSTGHVGFVYKGGKVTSLVKDGSAARNGLLTDHYICEVNGQNVIGLKDSQLKDVLASSPSALTITVMPKVIYEHMIKRMSSGLLRSAMDHSVPEV